MFDIKPRPGHQDQPAFIEKVLEAAHRPRLTKTYDRDATQALESIFGAMLSKLPEFMQPWMLKNNRCVPKQSTCKEIQRLLAAGADPDVGLGFISEASTWWICSNSEHSQRPIEIASDLIDAGASMDCQKAIGALCWVVDDPRPMVESEVLRRTLERDTAASTAPSRPMGRL